MGLEYAVIEILTGEEARYGQMPLHESIVEYVRSLKLAARCLVYRGICGGYENGEIATGKIMDLSFNMPVKIEIVLPGNEAPAVLAELEKRMEDGIIGIREFTAVCHKTRKQLFPRQIRVKDAMTLSPKTVAETDAVSDAVRLLLSSTFTGLPVLDGENRPTGVISQGDLIYRAGMPLRLALMAESDPGNLAGLLERLSRRKASEIMTSPSIVISEDRLLTDAVDLMLAKNAKRLPVVDEEGRLTGILSRMDIFQTVTHEAPDWKAIRRRRIQVSDDRSVSEIMRKDIHKVGPDAPLAEVLRMVVTDDMQRVAVVDGEGQFLGMISDRHLLDVFTENRSGLLRFFAKVNPFSDASERFTQIREKVENLSAGEIMRTDLSVIQENAPIEEAFTMITEKEIKRLPVVDADGKFRGMLSRDALLRYGYKAWKKRN